MNLTHRPFVRRSVTKTDSAFRTDATCDDQASFPKPEEWQERGVDCRTRWSGFVPEGGPESRPSHVWKVSNFLLGKPVHYSFFTPKGLRWISLNDLGCLRGRSSHFCHEKRRLNDMFCVNPVLKLLHSSSTYIILYQPPGHRRV